MACFYSAPLAWNPTGVDNLDCPMTAGMLPPVFRTMVERGSRIRWSAMAGLDVTVEHRIPC
jgi:hypothetical protein